MKREGIEAATKLLEMKLISEQQFADLVIKSLNGHAAPAVQQQLNYQRRPHHTHQFTIQQVTDMVDMFQMGKSYEQIAQTLTVRYDLKPVTKRSVAAWIWEIKNGSKVNKQRFQTPEWQETLTVLRQRLS